MHYNNNNFKWDYAACSVEWQATMNQQLHHSRNAIKILLLVGKQNHVTLCELSPLRDPIAVVSSSLIPLENTDHTTFSL